MFLRFQEMALVVSYGFRQYSLLFLIEVFYIKKACTIKNKVSSERTPVVFQKSLQYFWYKIVANIQQYISFILTAPLTNQHSHKVNNWTFKWFCPVPSCRYKVTFYDNRYPHTLYCSLMINTSYNRAISYMNLDTWCTAMMPANPVAYPYA